MRTSLNIWLRLVAVLTLLVSGGCGTELTCGAGTVDKDGACVPSEANTDPTLPAVASVSLTELMVAEEGQRKVYVNYPLHVSGALEVTGDAFETDLVVGLSNKDGSKSCFAGVVPVSHGGGEEADTVQFSGAFYVQSGCDVLDGETDVKAWVAFDPFRRVNLNGAAKVDLPTTTDAAALLNVVQQSTLDAAGCKAPSSSHPDTCDTALEVVKSPGLDLSLQSLELGSSVALVTEKSTEVPDLVASSEFRVYGDAFDEDTDLLEDKPVSTTFYIAPKIDFSALPAAATMAVYAPRELKVLDYGVSKAGEATLKELRQKFLNSLQAETSKLQGFALRIDDETRALMFGGKWAPFVKYQVTACAAAPFEETDAEGVNEDNNCRSVDVILARDVEPTEEILGGHGPDKFVSGEVTGSIGGWQKHKTNQYGSTSTLGVSLHNHARAVYVASKGKGTAKHGELAMGLRANVTGWFAQEILDLDLQLRLPPSDKISVSKMASTAPAFQPSIRVFGTLVFSMKSYLPVEEGFSKFVPVGGLSVDESREFCFLGACVKVSLKVANGCGGKIVGKMSLQQKLITASIGPSCGQTVSGETCITLIGKACGKGSVTLKELELPLSATVKLNVKNKTPAQVTVTATAKISAKATLVKGKITGTYGATVVLFDWSWGTIDYTLWNIAQKKFVDLKAN